MPPASAEASPAVLVEWTLLPLILERVIVVVDDGGR